MNLGEKLQMAQQLDRLGVDIMEAGFPIASDGDFEAVKSVAAEVRRPVVAALATRHSVRVTWRWSVVAQVGDRLSRRWRAPIRWISIALGKL